MTRAGDRRIGRLALALVAALAVLLSMAAPGAEAAKKPKKPKKKDEQPLVPVDYRKLEGLSQPDFTQTVRKSFMVPAAGEGEPSLYDRDNQPGPAP